MRFLGCFLGSVALLTIVGGAIALAMGFPGGNESPAEAEIALTEPSQSPTAQSSSGTESSATTATISGTVGNPSTMMPSDEPADDPLPTATAVVTDVDVDDPVLEVPTFPLASVRATFTEAHQFGQITVSFRPGMYTVEYAAEIAAKTEAALDEANAKLQTNWSDDLTVFLADQLFAEDCVGCQGFTESDFRWIFMLDDGSVMPDEFEALLVHEVAHLIAGNEIHLPFDIFYVEGLAMWVMTDDLVRHGYVSPLQTTAWVYGAGELPSLQAIMDDDFAGRMRKRLYYDAAGAFAFFVIDTYGWDAYVSLYRQNPIESVLGKSVAEVETEWHGYLEPHAGTMIGGVGAEEWWTAARRVIDAYGRFYDNPDVVTADQYRLLTLSRLAINRADVGNALEFLAQSGV
ncbi:hypothetical protein BH23CHL2_BH23CHL2_16800 [soil metagenome]